MSLDVGRVEEGATELGVLTTLLSNRARTKWEGVSGTGTVGAEAGKETSVVFSLKTTLTSGESQWTPLTLGDTHCGSVICVLVSCWLNLNSATNGRVSLRRV